MNNYCPLPFRHVFVEPRGVKPCCSYTEMYDGSIDDWLHSNELAELQATILNDEIAKGCRDCFNTEKTYGTSTRLGALHDYPDLIATDTNIDYVDYRSSNICNFKCRSCEPYFSNGISLETKKNKELLNFYSNSPEKKVAPTTVEDKNWIIDNIHRIRRLMFTGGEPTIIPEVKEIIEYIRSNSIESVNILITTNGSFTDNYWVDITKQMSNIHWTMSLDCVGDIAEIVRHGTKWEVVSKNIETMFEISPSVNIGTVITNLNLFHLRELFEFSNHLYNKYQHVPNGKDQLIEICNWPSHMQPTNLPPELQSQAIDYLKSINIHTLQQKQKLVVEQLIKMLIETEYNPAEWQKFVTHNNILDAIRGQDHSALLTTYKYPAKEDIIHASK